MSNPLDTVIKALPKSDKYVMYLDLDKIDIDEACEWAKQIEYKLGDSNKLIVLPYSTQLDRINKDMLKAWIDLATEAWEGMKDESKQSN